MIEFHKIFPCITYNNKYPQNLSTTFKFSRENFEIIAINSFLANVLMLYPLKILENQIIGNKAKGRISKRVFQENKARQIFRKTNISYPLIRTKIYIHQSYKRSLIQRVLKIFRKTNTFYPLIPTRTCAYHGVRNVSFSENFAYVLNG